MNVVLSWVYFKILANLDQISLFSLFLFIFKTQWHTQNTYSRKDNVYEHFNRRRWTTGLAQQSNMYVNAMTGGDNSQTRSP